MNLKIFEMRDEEEEDNDNLNADVDINDAGAFLIVSSSDDVPGCVHLGAHHLFPDLTANHRFHSPDVGHTKFITLQNMYLTFTQQLLHNVNIWFRFNSNFASLPPVPIGSVDRAFQICRLLIAPYQPCFWETVQHFEMLCAVLRPKTHKQEILQYS